MRVFVLDPGINRSGVALFKGGVLVKAGVLDAKTIGQDRAERCYAIAELATHFVGSSLLDEFVSEWPKVYHGEKNVKGGDPNDLLYLPGIIMATGSALQAGYQVTMKTYLPKEWTGSVRKDESVKGAKTSPRAQKILRRLHPTEMDVWNKQVKYHDTVDAVGIGMHHLGRMERIRVFHRSGQGSPKAR